MHAHTNLGGKRGNYRSRPSGPVHQCCGWQTSRGPASGEGDRPSPARVPALKGHAVPVRAAEAAERGCARGPDVTWLIPLPMTAPGSPLRARGRTLRAAGRAGGAAGGGARAALAARSTRDAALLSGPAHVGDSGPRPRGWTPSAHALVLAHEHKAPNLQCAHARRRRRRS